MPTDPQHPLADNGDAPPSDPIGRPDAGAGRPRRESVRPTYFHQSAGAIVMIDGRCLTLRRVDRDEWVLPKGHLEEGERAEDAAIREVREETGLVIVIDATLGSTRYEFGPKREHRKRVEWFLAHPVGGDLALESIFRESVLLDGPTAQTVLTHAADRELAARAFALARDGSG